MNSTGKSPFFIILSVSIRSESLQRIILLRFIIKSSLVIGALPEAGSNCIGSPNKIKQQFG